MVTGLAAVVVALLWMLLYRNPERHPRLSEDERRYITADQAPVSQRPSIRYVLIKREFWGMAAARFLTEPAWQTFSFWIPLYMVTQRGMDIKEFALFGWLPFLAADLGSVVGGYLSPYLHGKLHISLVNSRIAGVGLGAFCMIGPAFVGLVSGPVVAILLFSLGGFAHQMLSSLLYALVTDKFEKQDVATATGFTGMAGYLGAHRCSRSPSANWSGRSDTSLSSYASVSSTLRPSPSFGSPWPTVELDQRHCTRSHCQSVLPS